MATNIPVSPAPLKFPRYGLSHFGFHTSAWLQAFKHYQAVPIVLLSAAVLGPLFWQPVIHAGDLPSHVYNAWLATLIQHRHAPIG